MKAIVSRSYGLRNLKVEEVPAPVPGDDEALVKVFATSLNFATMFFVKGRPYFIRLMKGGLFRPAYPIPGGEIAGRIEAVGRNIARLKPGDEVYGDTCAAGCGAFAEYVCAPEGALALKPANLSFEEAAAVPRFTYAPNTEDLTFMKVVIEAGRVKPVIDSVYAMRDIAEAFRHFGEGHSRGRVVMKVC